VQVLRRFWPILLVLLTFACGCATGVRGGKKYTRFAPDSSEVIEPARHSGDHFIVVRMAHAKGLARLPDTKRELRRGDRVGFTRDEDGHLVAVAGNATCVLTPEPIGVAYYAWYYRDDRPLNDIAHKLRDGAGAVGAVAAQAAIVGGVALAQSAIDDALHANDEDDDQPESMKRQQKRERNRSSTTARSAPVPP
jgi:hypothetical protein